VHSTLGASEPGGGLIVHVAPAAGQRPSHELPVPPLPALPPTLPALPPAPPDALQFPSQHQVRELVQVHRIFGAADPGGGEIAHVEPGVSHAPAQPPPCVPPVPPVAPADVLPPLPVLLQPLASAKAGPSAAAKPKMR
jgi:hypothetical protein